MSNQRVVVVLVVLCGLGGAPLMGQRLGWGEGGTALASVQPALAQQGRPEPAPDVPFVPTPPGVVDEMLRIANLQPGDVLYDLGSGDGRIVIRAAQQYGVRAVGIDINPVRVAEARANARRAGVQHLAAFRQADLFEADIRPATVVTLYLLPSVNERLRPKLQSELRPGTRIISHAFDIKGWEPEQVVEVDGTKLYLWVVPERPAGPR